MKEGMNRPPACCFIPTPTSFDAFGNGVMLLRPACLLVLALAAGPLVLADSAVSSDEKLLKDHKLPSDGPGLVEFLKKRISDGVSLTKLQELVEQLGDDDFFRREEASKQLLLAGPRARPMLLAALKHRDLEVQYRAGRV